MNNSLKNYIALIACLACFYPSVLLKAQVSDIWHTIEFVSTFEVPVAAPVVPFKIDDEVYFAAHEGVSGSFQYPYSIYRWNGNSFVFLQNINPSRPEYYCDNCFDSYENWGVSIVTPSNTYGKAYVLANDDCSLFGYWDENSSVDEFGGIICFTYEGDYETANYAYIESEANAYYVTQEGLSYPDGGQWSWDTDYEITFDNLANSNDYSYTIHSTFEGNHVKPIAFEFNNSEYFVFGIGDDMNIYKGSHFILNINDYVSSYFEYINGINSFMIDDNRYIGIYYYDDYVIYQFDGSTLNFVQIISVASLYGLSANKVTHNFVSKTNEQYLVLNNCPDLYKWTGNNFEIVKTFSVPISETYIWSQFEINNEIYLGINERLGSYMYLYKLIIDTQNDIFVKDYNALDALYTNTNNNPPWTDETNWLVPGVDAEQWYGINTNPSTQRVSEILLSPNQLSGTLPTEIGDLKGIITLYLDDNAIAGSIPASIGELPLIQNLNVSNNQFSGNLPVELYNLSTLSSLNLSDNGFTGDIAPQIAQLTNLSDVDFSSNQFSGSIPNEIGDLSLLSDCDLSNNQLTGPLPVTVTSLSNLASLNISNNLIEELPDLSGNNNLIGNLHVANNNLHFDDLERNKSLLTSEAQYYPQNTIPVPYPSEVIGEWEPFSYSFDIGGQNNYYQWFYKGIDDDDFAPFGDESSSGILSFDHVENTDEGQYKLAAMNTMFDDHIIIWSEPFQLIVTDNSGMEAGIPVESYNTLVAIYNLTHENGDWNHSDNWVTLEHANNWYGVTVVDQVVTKVLLDNNNLVGTLPDLAGLPGLIEFDVSGNTISGELPGDIYTLSNLQYLYVNDNEFSGSLGTLNMENWPMLKGLLLNNNQFTGDVPDALADQTDLLVLDLSHNQFTGLPDLSQDDFNSFQVSHNKLDFGALEPNVGDDKPFPSSSYYFPQSPEINISPDNYTVINGGQLTIPFSMDGEQNEYQWKHNGEDFGTKQETGDLVINSAFEGLAGKYYCVITNKVVEDLKFETNEVTVTISDNIEDLPLPLTATYNDEQIILHLDPHPVLSYEYVIERSTDNGATFEEVQTTGLLDFFEYRDADILPCQRYMYRIKAFNGQSYSPYSNQVSITAPCAFKPTNLRASFLGNSIKLRWDAAPGSYVMHYNIYRSKDTNTDYELISTYGEVTGTTYLDENIDEDATAYYYKVSTFSDPEYSGFSNEVKVDLTALADNPPGIEYELDPDPVYTVEHGGNRSESFVMNGETYVIFANGAEGNYDGWTYNTNCSIHKWNGASFELVQDNIATFGAFVFEYFEIEGDCYLTVVDYREGNSSCTTESNRCSLYKWDGNVFILDNTIVIDGEMLDFDHVNIDGKLFFTVAVMRNFPDNNWDRSFYIYNWNNDNNSFELFKDIPAHGARDIEHFLIDGTLFLALTNYRSLSNGTGYNQNNQIYKWQDNDFVLFDDIAGNGTRQIKHFTIEDENFLFFVNYYNGSSYDIYSPLYRWNGSEFIFFQDILGNGTMSCDIVEYDDEIFLVMGGYYSNGAYTGKNRIYKWDGNQFNLLDPIETQPLFYPAFVTHDNGIYLALPQVFSRTGGIWNTATSSTKIYKYDGQSFIWQADINTGFRNNHVAPVYIGDRTFFSVSSFLTNTNTDFDYEVNSKIYGFVPVGLDPMGIPLDEYQALLALYFATNGPGWDTQWDLDTPVDTWPGVTVTDGHVTAIDLANNLLDGYIPEDILALTQLQSFNITGNAITSIPDMTSLSITPGSLQVANNMLQFGVLEPNATLFTDAAQYCPQADFDVPPSVPQIGGGPFTLVIPATGQNNMYQWYKDGLAYGTQTDENKLSFATLTEAEAGNYHIEVSNMGCTIKSKQYELIVFPGPDPEDNVIIGGVKKTDYDALAKLYDATTQQGDWTVSTNWKVITDDIGVSDWYNVEVLNGRVVGVNLPGNNLNGELPPELRNLSMLNTFDVENNILTGDVPNGMQLLKNLETLNIENNQIENIPDFRVSLSLSEPKLAFNKLTFEDLEPNIGFLPSAELYSPQADIEIVPQTFYATSDQGFTYTLETGGEHNHYTWAKLIDGTWEEVSSTNVLNINPFDESHVGTYKCVISNDLFGAFQLQTIEIQILWMECGIGDIDCDNKVLTFDASLVLNYFVGHDVYIYGLPREWEGTPLFYRADVDLDNQITEDDARYIFNNALGIEPVLPVPALKSGSRKASIVTVMLKNNRLTFTSDGNLEAFSLDAEAPSGITLGEPVFSNISMSAANTNGSAYKLAAISSEAIPEGTVFLEIPVTGKNLRSPLSIQTRANKHIQTNRFHLNTIGIETTATNAPEVLVYPNPFTDEITFEVQNIGNAAPITLAIYDMTGRKVYENTHENNGAAQQKIQLNMQNMHTNTQGMYMYKICTSNYEKRGVVVRD